MPRVMLVIRGFSVSCRTGSLSRLTQGLLLHRGQGQGRVSP